MAVFGSPNALADNERAVANQELVYENGTEDRQLFKSS